MAEEKPKESPKDGLRDALASTNPMSFLREAIRANPAVKWALGVGGLASVIVIVKNFKINLAEATLGVVVLLVLMTALLLFSKIAADKKFNFRRQAKLFMWFAVILVMAVALAMFLSVFFNWPLHWRDGMQSPPVPQASPPIPPKVEGITRVLGTIPPNGGPPGSNTAFLNFKDSDIQLDKTKSFRPGDPSFFLAPADGDYRVDANLQATYDANRPNADYMSFYLEKMSADKAGWEDVKDGGANDTARMPRANISISVQLQKGDRLALKAGNAAGIPIVVAGTFSVHQID